ncbi:MAG: hypothetical protein F4X11_20135 [Acidobacteria bacterium]|nr:hypothetical protein [Acidobacteriota bacterium]
MSGEIWTIRTENDDRVRRARSWLKKSKRAHSDVERFLYLWISFNAAYGQTADNGRFGAEGPRGPCETEIQEKFLHKICERDRPTRRLQAIVTGKECARAIRGLMKNEFIYEPYWDCVRAKSPFDAGKFAEENGGVERAITPGSLDLDPRQALPRIFRRLYTLRNQIVHGGVTVRNGWGRKQLRDGSRIMEKVIPAVLNIMKRDIANEPSSERWGHLRYPRHNSSHRRPE